jgi:hypothetical protein
LEYKIDAEHSFHCFWFKPDVSIFQKLIPSASMQTHSNSLPTALIQPFAAAIIFAALLQRAEAVGKLRTWRTPATFVAGISPSQRFGALRPALSTLATTTRRTRPPSPRAKNSPSNNHIPELGFNALQSTARRSIYQLTVAAGAAVADTQRAWRGPRTAGSSSTAAAARRVRDSVVAKCEGLRPRSRTLGGCFVAGG